MRPLVSLALVLTIFTACGATPEAGNLSAFAGTKQAERDFAAGHPKIYLTGGVVVYEPGVSDKDKDLVAKLPRDGSLSGCTNPRAPHAGPFVTAYNTEIILLLRKK